MRHATNKPTAAQADLTAQATRAVLNLSFAGGRYAHAVWWLISTLAILAQGTSRAVAVTQAFYFTIRGCDALAVFTACVCAVAGVRVVRTSAGVGDRPGRPSVCCQLLACAWAPVAGVGGRLLRGAWVARAFAFWAVGDRPGRPQGAASFCHQERVRERLLRACAGACCGRARFAGVRGHPVVGGACAPSNAAVADSLPRHKQQRLTQPSGCQRTVYTSRFVRVILSQGPC